MVVISLSATQEATLKGKENNPGAKPYSKKIYEIPKLITFY